jgi:hypothetical protein
MPTPAAVTPIPYASAYEAPEEGETETCAGLLAALQGIATTTCTDSGHATRGVHAKSHGLLRGN